MREIKFRAWNVEEQCWTCIENIEENMLANPVVHPPNTGKFELPDSDGFFIIEQFTGLLDKQGNEIYEGDILKVNEENGGEVEWVEWSEKELAWVCESNLDNGSWLSSCEGVVEIIGNIHEHKLDKIRKP